MRLMYPWSNFYNDTFRIVAHQTWFFAVGVVPRWISFLDESKDMKTIVNVLKDIFLYDNIRWNEINRQVMLRTSHSIQFMPWTVKVGVSHANSIRISHYACLDIFYGKGFDISDDFWNKIYVDQMKKNITISLRKRIMKRKHCSCMKYQADFSNTAAYHENFVDSVNWCCPKNNLVSNLKSSIYQK